MPTAKLHFLRYERAALQALPIELRYAFLFLGHAFNELAALQKLLYRAQAPNLHDVPAEILDGHNTNYLTICRLLVGKISEAIIRLNSPSVGKQVNEHFLPLVGGKEKLRLLNQAFSTSKWIHAVRNEHALHYPSMEDWSDALAEEPTIQHIVIGEVTGNTLFVASEEIALRAVLAEIDPKISLEDALGKLLNEILHIAALLGEFLQEASVRFAKERLGAKEWKTLEMDLPLLGDQHFGYFVGEPAG